ncbi:1,4-dihydroxy-2-naphthoate polyprenyltransferase [Virgibacillus alimentarius]|uniref:1,4-dihydroxy-2-naphthoate octaprenyltransferase n=1 Tax=Virgibacillus alimentarius TaxID=698769 RepID=A0ABS4S711_9BACI|nr:MULTISPECIES: 1,4-dihydroxy-2-naphthoate polyprenyltransferase [Virgibacillus]MBP2257292.1 1,4-dihydroxy-2-naphthoate octaprenyltransferase [Virgibacillus alimentarius]HLR67854.1 1,4-dihydroxy-2-naphthoate polyprenyltransferase [Virgibacillus sp.]
MQDKTNIKEVLNEKEGFQIWWRLLRPHTLTASFVPVFVGTMFAFNDGTIEIRLFLAMLLASILIQAATNMFNEYYDFIRGLDNEQSVGIGGTIVRDGIAPKTILNLAFTFFGIAILLGVYICMESSWWIAVIGLISMLFGYLYTGGPFPIAYTPLGELFSGFFMGTVIIGISYYIQTLSVTVDVILISIPVAIFIASIMLANNIRDLDGDKQNGRKTIAILIGRKQAVKLMGFLFTASYVLTVLYIILGILPILSIVVILSSIKARNVIKNFEGKTKPIEMLPAMIATGKTNTLYGILLGLSLLISHFI